LNTQLLKRLQEIRAQRASAVLVTRLADGSQWLLESDSGEFVSSRDEPLPDEIATAARTALRSGRSETREHAGARFLLHVFEAPLRLAIVGAVHIAQALVSMGMQMGYAVTLIDPRSAWATAERFPNGTIDRRWPGVALAEFAPDRRSAVVTLTHDPKLDDPALEVALASDAFYIGALGSRRTQARRLDRLRALGVSEAQLARIHGPVGLDIGAVSPAEIAVSILAEMTQVLGESRRS